MEPPLTYSSIYLHYITPAYVPSTTFFIYFKHFSYIIFIQLSTYLFTKIFLKYFTKHLPLIFIIHKSFAHKNIREIFCKYFAYIANIFIPYVLIFFPQFLLQVAVAPHFQLAETENPLFLQIQSYPEMIVILQPLVL